LLSDPARQAELTALLESYSQNVEKLRAEIANLTRRSKARYDCGHSLSDLIDMVESMNLSRKEVEERMQWVQQQMQREQKVCFEVRLQPERGRAWLTAGGGIWDAGPANVRVSSSKPARRTSPNSTAPAKTSTRSCCKRSSSSSKSPTTS